MNAITVLKVAPNCQPEVVTIQNDLRSLQEAVSINAPYESSSDHECPVSSASKPQNNDDS